MLVLGIETSTPQTAVALGNEQGIIAATVLTMGRAGDEVVMPAITHLLEWSDISLSSVSGVAVGLGPGLFTGMRVGIAAAKTLAQLLQVPIAGLASLDVVAFSVRYSRRLICAVVDAKRGEVFHAFYLPVPGGIARQSNFEVASPEALRAELEARPEDILLVGNGALVYRRQLQEAGNHVDFASAAYAFPAATALVELAIPRFQREEFDRLYELKPFYVRKTDAEIAWDKRRGAG
ncbi:MAG TPA: tRNA (adenosine(37)-N6)-threonylcarbamoyltransferase complex dimerization subunit type 1 TsaB [Actinomycetota bacterium]